MVHQLVAGGDEFLGETVERRFVNGALFEQGVSRTQCFCVPLEEGEIGGIRLGKQQVDEPSTPAGGPFDKLQVFRAENNRPESPQELRDPPDVAVIERDLAFGGRPVEFEVVFLPADDMGPDEVAGLIVADHLCAGNAAERAQCCQEVDCLQEVALALSVVTDQEMESGLEIKIEPSVVPEIAEP